MAINPLSASVPAAPIVDSDGNVTTVWRGFFLALQARTGGAPGVSVGTVNNDLAAETVARTAGDAALNAAIAAETTARAAADAAETANRIAADAIFAEKISDGGEPMALETAARLAGDAQSRGFAFFMAA
jgi:hypothetical protein